uniref:DUF834 domain-containing protein n=1 Tax=Oryza nivara TaxID=4536 RepID=A0A0E0IBW6_ORYNI
MVGGEGCCRRRWRCWGREVASEVSRDTIDGKGRRRWASAASAIEVEGGDIMDPRGSGSGGCGMSTAETLHERERNLSGLSGDSGDVWRP